jgi:hypothetical protein
MGGIGRGFFKKKKVVVQKIEGAVGGERKI